MSRTNRTTMVLLFSSAVVLRAAGPAARQAQGAGEIRAVYTKQEVSVPMRDGVKLFTQIYAPRDQSRRHPILLTRTPYSVAPYGANEFRASVGPSPLTAADGYIVVYQDVRGRWMSEGTFDDLRPYKPVKAGAKDIDETTDTYDTIAWLLEHLPNHNGRVGQWGISYPGFYTSMGMIDAHPALVAASPQAPVADWFAQDDWHHNGAFLLAHAFNWFRGNGWPFDKPSAARPGTPIDMGTQDGYQFYLELGPVANANERYFKHMMPGWNALMQHGTNDAHWQARNIRPHLRRIKPAVMTVGGWYDAENLYGTLETYRSVERQNPTTFNILVMGPWVHGGWARGTGRSLGDIPFGSDTAALYREEIERRFFLALLHENTRPMLPEAYVFETGGNSWRTFDTWPPPGTTQASLYLHAGGRVSFDPPAAGSTPADGFDEYTSDPRKPVPIVSSIVPNMAQRYMIDDQRFAARRPDVLVYQTEPLTADLTLAGPVSPRLIVSTTGTDQDVIVKLVDVWPGRSGPGATEGVMLDHYQELVRGDVLRGKFRESLSKPVPFVPGRPTPLAFELGDVFHTFRRGHRLMIQIQSTWFPLFDINPGKFVDIYTARDADFQKTTQRVYLSAAQPSSIGVHLKQQ